jgi:hypothetical protein
MNQMSEFVELDLEMPVKSTPDVEDPNTMQKISSVLAMDLNDHMEEIPCQYNRQDKMFRVDHVSACFLFTNLARCCVDLICISLLDPEETKVKAPEGWQEFKKVLSTHHCILILRGSLLLYAAHT